VRASVRACVCMCVRVCVRERVCVRVCLQVLCLCVHEPLDPHAFRMQATSATIVMPGHDVSKSPIPSNLFGS